MDPDALFDALVEEDVVVDNETVSLTDDFEHRWSIYLDTYASVTPDAFDEAVAEAFDVSVEEARAIDVTRAEFSYYLALHAHLDGEYASDEIGVMAEMVDRIGPSSPVPDDIDELSDEAYPEFLAANPDCVVSIWKRDCAPCDAVAENLDRIRDAAPDDVAFVGMDGDDVVEFRREFEVEAAPAVLAFRDGDLAATTTGSVGTEAIIETLRDVYD